MNLQEMRFNFSLGIVHGSWGFRKMFVHWNTVWSGYQKMGAAIL